MLPMAVDEAEFIARSGAFNAKAGRGTWRIIAAEAKAPI